MELRLQARGREALYALCLGTIAMHAPASIVGSTAAAAACVQYENTIEVSSLADSGPGSLRQAISDANYAGGNVLVFFSVGGVIALAGEMPVLTAGSVTIDGSSAPPPGIVVDGGERVSNGLLVEGPSVCVRAVTFQNFLKDGLRIRGQAAQDCWVEGVTALGNGDDGLQVSEGAGATLVGNHSEGNGNKGLLVFDGASVLARDNWLGGNGDGVTVSNGSAAALFDNIVTGNDDIGIGLTLQSQAQIVGNALVGNGAVGPNSEGVRLTRESQAQIAQNEIRSNGDNGVVVMGHSHADIVGNEIAENGGGGIVVAFSGEVAVEGNAIVGNGRHGVRLVSSALGDLGGGGRSAGGNLIQSNWLHEVRNETENPVSATANSWEEMSAAELDESEIYDDDEEEGLGRVDFVPRMGESDWDGDDAPDREDPCPHLGGVAPQPMVLRGAQMLRVDEGKSRGRIRFSASFFETSVTHEPDGGDGFFLTVRQDDGRKAAELILPGGSPWVRSRSRNEWDYRKNGSPRVRSQLRELGVPGTGRYRVSLDYDDALVDPFPPEGLLQYALEFVATDTCYHAVADRCLSMFVPTIIYLCR